MKKTALILLTGLLLLGCQPNCEDCAKNKGGDKEGSAEVTKDSLKNQMDKLNYSVGLEIGTTLKRNALEFQEGVFMKGLQDGMTESENPLLTEEERMEVKREHSKVIMEKRKQEREEEAKKNKEAGEKLLADNKAKEGVVVVESGLQYKIIKEGTGPKPAATDRVKVNYKGTLADGTEFDSSYKRNKPAEFEVSRVVKGWTEALQLMPTGSKWELHIPADLGYGERGAGRKIPPNSVLIFEVELLEILPPKPAGEKPAMPMGSLKGGKPIQMMGGKPGMGPRGPGGPAGPGPKPLPPKAKPAPAAKPAAQ